MRNHAGANLLVVTCAVSGGGCSGGWGRRSEGFPWGFRGVAEGVRGAVGSGGVGGF